MAGKVAVVTGSNKGIGFGIVKELLKRGVSTVYLTARDEERGRNAVQALKKEGLAPSFHPLEVTDEESVKTFAKYLKKKHGGLDILINNAGVIQNDWNNVTYEDFQRVITVNYRSILTIQEHLFPLIRQNGRVVNISSDCGHISNINNTYWIKRLTNPNIELEDIDAFVQWALDSVKNGTVDSKDFVQLTLMGYKVSKIALCALTRLQQRNIGRNISILSVHPGYVVTDMTGNSGDLTVEQSAEAVVYVALDVDNSVKGKYYWFDKKQRDWADHSLKIHLNANSNLYIPPPIAN